MSSRIINIYEMKASFSRFAKEVMKGKSFIISMRNKPFAELRPLPGQGQKPVRFGVLKNSFQLPRNFNEPLAEFEAEFYGRK